MNLKYLLSLLVLTALMVACGDDEEEMPTQVTCDTEDVTYTNTISAIVDLNCATAPCHSDITNAGGFSMMDYDKTSAATLFDNFLPAIRHEDGAVPMPQSADMLPECEIAQIEAWIEAGVPE